jgi:LytR cell envelope-related transcriptional attenuator
MTEATFPRSTPSRGADFRRSVAFSALRGATLIGLAVIVGIVLLQVVDNGSSGPAKAGGAKAGATSTTKAASNTTAAPTTTAAPGGAVKPPAQIRVLVLNGSGVTGAAKTKTNQLRALGYNTLTPTDTPARTGDVAECKAGFEREAQTLAKAAGAGTKVVNFPTPPPPNTDNVDCIIIVGKK